MATTPPNAVSLRRGVFRNSMPNNAYTNVPRNNPFLATMSARCKRMRSENVEGNNMRARTVLCGTPIRASRTDTQEQPGNRRDTKANSWHFSRPLQDPFIVLPRIEHTDSNLSGALGIRVNSWNYSGTWQSSDWNFRSVNHFRGTTFQQHPACLIAKLRPHITRRWKATPSRIHLLQLYFIESRPSWRRIGGTFVVSSAEPSAASQPPWPLPRGSDPVH